MGLGAVEVVLIYGLIAAVLVILLWGNRPTPERFAATHALSLDRETRAVVAKALIRTYRGRLIGSAAGFVLALVLAALGGTRLNFTGGLAAILAGTLIGISLAQFTRSPQSGSVRVASLEARHADDYRPRRAKVTIGLLLGLLLAYSAACLSADASGRFLVFVITVPVLAIAAVVLGLWFQSRIVEHAQAPQHPDQARVDDALRASAVRAVHHAVVGLILCGTAFLGVAGANWGPIHVMVDDRVVYEVPPGATSVVTMGNRLWWTDADGARRTHLVSQRMGSVTGWQQTYDGLFPTFNGALLALATGIGALFEWRAAARAWRGPGPRRRQRATGPSSLAPTGGAA